MRAIISVSDKSGVVDFARGLNRLGFEVFSTGGTKKALSEAGVPVKSVSDITGFPEILDGRVKTLHPAVHGGILARRDLPSHMAELAKNKITPIDLIAVNLYPFVQTVAKDGVTLDDALENTSEVISEITHYAGIVSFLEWQDKIFYKGISRILDQPEFRNVDKIRLLVKLMEDKKPLLDIINRDFSGPVKVYIGSELGFPEMENCSLIVSSFKLKKQPSGRLAVLGPMRMEYDHIIPTMEYISEVLNQILEDF